ncbi:multisubunit sodium/proton antiporter, MrpB subunit [Clostridium aceticum]|uniref:Multisubunit sodium/proton antiporter, MrpB subunit n=1 Tax=Clostridium aceticum TaxID=84022 RepID=A0A0D8IAB7_9CLOT|nr:MnhB domain-containing protein [Clostridium aceticum]AKL96414.1 multisubunit sodium/proton antiporter, MrpB subunit [Clostridium aceticum]KJF26984.1 sodium:proton antiporter [Clostridium aceticum]
MREDSQIVSRMIGLMHPFILLLGFYIILNGHKTPGGGFQGGAILSAVFMSRYLGLSIQDIRLNILQVLEKALFTIIIILPVLFVLWEFKTRLSFMNELYLITMNVLIGIKVGCGLSIIFFRFVFYESR